MAESVYKVIELVGTSKTSWERAAAEAVKTASKSLRDLRIAEVSKLDLQLEEGKAVSYRARVKVSFKYGDSTPPPAPAKKVAAKKAPAPAPAKPAKKAKKKAKRRAKKR